MWRLNLLSKDFVAVEQEITQSPAMKDGDLTISEKESDSWENR